MSSSSSVIPPIPFRTSVGAIWETIPPAPTQRTRLRENTFWSKPGIFCCRSVASEMAVPRRLIQFREMVNAGRIVLHSFSVDFYFKVLIHPHEAHKAVTAEDGHQGQVSGAFEPLLEVFV